jgi:hypothetical protein
VFSSIPTLMKPLVVTVVACNLLACEASLTPAIAPTVDTTGKFGVETRVDLTLGFGDSDHYVFYGGGGPGAGYSEPLGPYFLHSLELGVQGGGVERRPLVRGRGGLVITPRVGAEQTLWGFGGVADVLFGVAETKRPQQWGRLLLGFRFQGECLCTDFDGDEPGPDPVGLLSHALVMQWVIVHEPSRFGARAELEEQQQKEQEAMPDEPMQSPEPEE